MDLEEQDTRVQESVITMCLRLDFGIGPVIITNISITTNMLYLNIINLYSLVTRHTRRRYDNTRHRRPRN